MSRCFPYPPPGYTLSNARNDALIESIKLQKEKERKKEKKEKRKERKEQKKDNTSLNLDKYDILKTHINDESDIPKHHIRDKSDLPKNHIRDKSDISCHLFAQKSVADAKVEFFHEKEADAEQIEQSNLTEEHACLASLPIPSSSFESTEKSKKRKRHFSLEDDTHVHGKILIRLPSSKQNELHALAQKLQQPSSILERSHLLDGSRDVEFERDVLPKFLNGTTPHNTEHFCSTSRPHEAEKTGIINKLAFPKKVVLAPMEKMELQYKNLLEDCFPPLIQDGFVDDLDWLLLDRNQETLVEKKPIFGIEGLSCSRSLGLWPRAEYMLEMGMCALPFTVPY